MGKLIDYLRQNGILFVVIAFGIVLIVIFYNWGKENGCYDVCKYIREIEKTNTDYSDQCHLYCDNHGKYK